MVVTLILIGIILIAVIIIIIIAKSRSKLKAENKTLRKIAKIEDHAIDSLEAIMQSKEEIEKVNNVKKEELRKVSGSDSVAAALNKL